MSKQKDPDFRRGMAATLAGRLAEPRRFLQMVTGPRQVGKTTLVEQVLAEGGQAFGFSLEQYLYFGGYPGAASLIADPERWRRYVLDALIETTISRDVLLMTRVDKPALLRRLLELGCRYSGQVLSYTKMLGQLQD